MGTDNREQEHCATLRHTHIHRDKSGFGRCLRRLQYHRVRELQWGGLSVCGACEFRCTQLRAFLWSNLPFRVIPTLRVRADLRRGCNHDQNLVGPSRRVRLRAYFVDRRNIHWENRTSSIPKSSGDPQVGGASGCPISICSKTLDLLARKQPCPSDRQ